MSEGMNIPSAMSMPLGIMLGFITKNINKVPEEKLRYEVEKNVHLMAGWLEGPKHDFD